MKSMLKSMPQNTWRWGWSEQNTVSKVMVLGINRLTVPALQYYGNNPFSELVFQQAFVGIYNYFLLHLSFTFWWDFSMKCILISCSCCCLSWQGQAAESQELLHTDSILHGCTFTWHKSSRVDTVQNKMWDPKWNHPAAEKIPDVQ